MANDNEIRIGIGIDDKELKEGLRSAEKDVEKFLETLTSQFGKFSLDFQSFISENLSGASSTSKAAKGIRESLAKGATRELQRQYQSNTQGDFKQFVAVSKVLEKGLYNAPAPNVNWRDSLNVDSEGTKTVRNEFSRTELALQRINDKFHKFSSMLSGLKTKSKVVGALERSFHNLGKRISMVLGNLKRIVLYRSVRAALSAITSGVKEGTNNLVLYSEAMGALDRSFANETMSAFATKLLEVKNSVGSAAVALLQVLQPAIIAICNAVIRAINLLSQLFRSLKGYGDYMKAKEYVVDYADGLNKASGSAKELKKQLLGFDELNVLNAPSTGGGGGAEAKDYTEMFDPAPIEDRIARIGNAVQKVAEDFNSVREKVEENIGLVESTASKALLGVGAILALSGANIPLGLGMMAVGAIGLGKSLTADWSTMDTKLSNTIGAIEGILIPAELAVGAILAFSNANVPLGIGLMAAGVLQSYATNLNWDNLPNSTKGVITALESILGVAFLAVGAVLAFSSPTTSPVGIGLMAAGALSLASAASLNWSWITEKVDWVVKNLLGTIAAALLVVGGVLAFSGGNVPLGIGLLGVGALTLGSSIKEDWSFLSEKTKGVIAVIARELGAALLVVGAILAFSGAATPLGIGLMVAGGASLGTAAVIDWDNILKELKAAFGRIKEWFGSVEDWVKSKVDWLNDKLSFLNVSTGSNIWEHGNNGAINLNPSVPKSTLRANGGYPEQGSMFIAGEAGAEFVGNINGKTGVMNTDQFGAVMQPTTEAIYAIGSAIVGAVNGIEMPSVRIGDRDIYKASKRGERLTGSSLVVGAR